MIKFVHIGIIVVATLVFSRITVIAFLFCLKCLLFVAMDERLSSYALIARAALGATVPLVTKLFSERIMMLHQVLF